MSTEGGHFTNIQFSRFLVIIGELSSILLLCLANYPGFFGIFDGKALRRRIAIEDMDYVYAFSGVRS